MENTMRLDKRPAVRMAAKMRNIELLPASGAGRDDTHAEERPDRTIAKSAATVMSLRGLSLAECPLSSFAYPPASIVELDLSHNRLAALPDLSALRSLVSLSLRRNAFRALPPSLARLPRLARLDAARNELRPSAELLVLLAEHQLPSLQTLDLTFNKKLYTRSLSDLLSSSLPAAAVHLTVTSPPPPGAYVGDSSGERDPALLRSQLEPYTTLQLRKRLVDTFGHRPHSMYGAPPEGRAEVMTSLLREYAKTGPRRLVRSLGTPVPPPLMAAVLRELRTWSDRYDRLQERPMIRASQYMILRSPTEAEEKAVRLGSRRAHAAMRKYRQNLALWGAAAAAMATVDPDFARAFTGLAVTRGFVGSPHIDTTNIGPFYGLSVGDFEEGTGGVRVELDPMTVCEVNTKDRLGRIDGRFPHWVAPYGEGKTRYSLIFYLTEGEVQPKTTAVLGHIIEEAEP